MQYWSYKTRCNYLIVSVNIFVISEAHVFNKGSQKKFKTGKHSGNLVNQIDISILNFKITLFMTFLSI